MSKRTSGTFREYLKTRNIDLVTNNSDSNISTSTEKSPLEHEPDDLEEQQSQQIDNRSGEIIFTRKGSMRRSNKSTASIKCDKNGNKSNAIGNETKLNNDYSNDMEYDRNGNHEIGKSTKSAAISNSSFLRKYDDEVGTPKTHFESTDGDWYASASDMEDSDSAVSKPYGYNAVNPVLECVNQVMFCK